MLFDKLTASLMAHIYIVTIAVCSGLAIGFIELRTVLSALGCAMVQRIIGSLALLGIGILIVVFLRFRRHKQI